MSIKRLGVSKEFELDEAEVALTPEEVAKWSPEAEREIKTRADYRPLKYKRRPKLLADELTFAMIRSLAMIRCTQSEAAAVLQVKRDTLVMFMARYPEARAAWEDGLENARANLRRLLWKHAESDPAQARFLAKQKDWLDYDEGKGRQTVDVTVTSIARDERVRRVQELQAKVIGSKPVETIEIIEALPPKGEGE